MLCLYYVEDAVMATDKINKQSQKYVGLYIRVSTDFQAEEGYSVDIQTERLKAYCVSRGFKHYKLYVDGGWSGSNLLRPEIQNLITDIKHNKIDTVIVYKLDRLSRSQKDTLYFIEDLLIPYNISFISLHENLDTGSPYGRAMIGILSAFAQLERENIRERTHSGMLERVKEGYWPGGGRIPFGYDYDSNKGILVPNKDAEIVRKIFDLYLQGYSTYKISTIVGINMPTYIDKILKRKTYTGIVPYLGQEYKGKHEAIIPLEKFEEVENLQSQRAKNPSYTSTEYLFSGLLYCGLCGAKMRYQKYRVKHKGKPDTYSAKIYCYSKHKSKHYLVKDPNCKSIGIDAAKLDEMVIKGIMSLNIVLSKEGRERYEKERKENKQTKCLDVLGELNERKESVSAKIKKLYNVYAQNGDDLLLSVISDLQKEYQNLEKELKIETKKHKIEKIKNASISNIITLKNTWDYMSFAEKRHVVRSIIEKIVVLPGDNKTKQFSVEISFNLDIEDPVESNATKAEEQLLT